MSRTMRGKAMIEGLVAIDHAGVTAIDLAMMERALELAARAAAAGEVPVGAVVYRGEQVLAEAGNQREGARRNARAAPRRGSPGYLAADGVHDGGDA
jgi:hypothetical protein